MRPLFSVAIGIGTVLFGALSASSSYSLQNYSLGPGAGNNTTSTNYTVQTSTGEIVGQTMTSSNYNVNSGAIQAQQASVPPAPALSNGGGTYYNKLNVVVNTGGNASDTTFAIAVSTDSFTTTNYMQTDGSLGSTAFFQTYAQWGGSTGATMVGLASGTTYQVKVSAMQGKFTNTAYGPVASQATVSNSLSFSLAQNTLSFSSLLSGSVITSPTLGMTLATNANFGATMYVSDANSGLKSLRSGYTIASSTGTLGSLSEGYGLQAGAVSQSSGGPLAAVSPYDNSGTSVGILSSSLRAVFSSANPLVGGTANVALLGKASNTVPSSSDYGDILTFLAAANY